MADQPLAQGPAVLPGLPRLRWPWAAAAVVCLLAAMGTGIIIGPAHLGFSATVEALMAKLPFVNVHNSLDSVQLSILWSLRIPRVVLGVLVGGMLAIAGAAYQGAFRNPLADPYLLGAAAGAELGATLAIAFAPASTVVGVNLVLVAAFTGSVLAVAGAYALGRTVRSAGSVTTLILAGVAIAAFLNALQTFVQQRESRSFREVYSWILGHLVTAGWDGVLLILPYVVVSAGVIFAHRRLLDALSVGDEEVATLGVSPRRIRLVVVAAATVGTAAAVAIGGTIGFVGIIVPHTVRLLVGRSYRVVVPLSLLLGAAFLVLADTLARTVASPAEIPIGVITAFVGAPFFVVVMRSTRTVDP